MRKLGILLFVVTMSVGATLAGPLYFGASVGDTSVKVDDSAGDFDGSATSYKVYGGYRFMKFFGVEGSYIDFGSPDDSVGGTDVKIDATGWDAFAVGVLPIGDHFEVFGKLGLLFWDTDIHIQGSGSDSDSGNDTVWGLGAAFIFGKHLGVRAEYELFNIEDTDDVSMFSVGAEWRF